MNSTKTYTWKNGKGNVLVITLTLAYELDNLGNKMEDSDIRKIKETLTVDGKEHSGWIMPLRSNHPLYSKGVRATFGDYAILESHLIEIQKLKEELKNTAEFKKSEDIKNEFYSSIDSYAESKTLQEIGCGEKHR